MNTITLPQAIKQNLDALPLPQDDPYRQAIAQDVDALDHILRDKLHQNTCLAVANNTMKESLEMIELIAQCNYPDALASILKICQTLRQPS